MQKEKQEQWQLLFAKGIKPLKARVKTQNKISLAINKAACYRNFGDLLCKTKKDSSNGSPMRLNLYEFIWIGKK